MQIWLHTMDISGCRFGHTQRTFQDAGLVTNNGHFRKQIWSHTMDISECRFGHTQWTFLDADLVTHNGYFRMQIGHTQ